jgi:hypothetical protein
MGRVSLHALTVSIVLGCLCACVSHPPSATAVPAQPASPATSHDDACIGKTSFEDSGGANEQSAPTMTSIQLLSITPQAGTPVHETTVLLAELAYSVEGFEPARFKILAQFDTNTSGVTTDGAFTNYPVLKTASGKLRFCFPLTYVWGAPNIKLPLTARFFLNKIYESGISEVIAHTDRLTFPTDALVASNPPPVATVSDEYAKALNQVYMAFEHHAAEQHYCADRFPDLASAISDAYERWATKYSAVNREINDLYVQFVTLRTGGNQERTQAMLEDIRQIASHDLQAGTPEQVRAGCKSFSHFMTSKNSDPDVEFPAELALIRKQAATLRPEDR